MGSKRLLAINFLVMGLIVGLVLGMSPVGAHVNDKMGHIFSHVKDKVGLTFVTESTDTNSESPKEMSASCPRDRHAIGGGAAVLTDDGSSLPEVALQVSEPFDAPDDPDGGINSWWNATAVETSPTDAEWYLHVTVKCARL